MHRPAALKSPAPVLGEKKPAHFGQDTERGWWSSESLVAESPVAFSSSPWPVGSPRRSLLRRVLVPPRPDASVLWFSRWAHSHSPQHDTERGGDTTPNSLIFFINSASLPSDFIKSSRLRGVLVIRHGFSPVGLIPLPERCLSHPIPLVFLQPFD